MRPLSLQLDWISRAQGRRGWQWLGAGLLCLGLAAGAYEISSLLDTNAGINGAEESLHHLRSRGVVAGAGVGAEQEALTLPWNRLLLDLEAAGGEDVALSSLETDAVKGSVRLMGEAKSLADVLAYVARLGVTTSLSGPQLLSQESRQSDGQGVVAFAIEARWNNR